MTSATPRSTSTAPGRAGHLRRAIGFHGLLFVSLGSIIGSGWLLGALKAAQVAGPASILSWVLAAAMLALLALTYAELGAAYPVAGGAGRFPYYSHGPIAGFAAGWAAWLQAVFIAPIEVIAAITYLNSVEAIHARLDMLDGNGMLHGVGLVIAVVMMAGFTLVNLAGARFLSESNSLVVLWKAFVPFLAALVIAGLRFESANFHAGGGFMPAGFHGVFAALTGGVVFSLQGFEQATQLAGEARDPRRDLSRAIVMAMAIGAVLYSLLQLVLIGGLDPANLRGGWTAPLGTGALSYGVWYALALTLGVGWLAKMLLIDAVVSPVGAGIVYMGTTARLSYALGEERELPAALARTNARGVPVVSILVAAGVGCLALGPYKSWSALVNVVTGATAIMYAFAPVALAALREHDPDRPRAYRMPAPRVLLPAAFCSANLILYWGGFETTWKLVCAMAVGFAVFAIGARVKRTDAARGLRAASWIAPWLLGHVALGWAGRYGGGAELLPEWVDLAVVIAFSLAIFWRARAVASAPAAVAAAIERDAHQLDTLAPAPSP